MTERTFSGATWEEKAGYCRALRTDDRIVVSGTAPVDDDGDVACRGDPGGQARRCWEIVEQAVEDLGGGLEDVVRTRMYVADEDAWEAVADVHGDVFGDHPPATTLVIVDALVDPGFLVEVEAEAVVTS